MILRTPQRKRRAESPPLEDNNNNTSQSPSSSRQLLVYEDLPAPDYSHDHSNPLNSDQMLCTYQCRQMVKADFFDALSSAEKQAHDYQSKFDALSEDFEKTQSERKKLRDKFLNTEQELAAARQREHILQEQLKKEVDFSQEQIREHIQAFSELEIKFQNEMDLRKKAEASAAKAEEQAHILENKLNTLSESINREKGRLSNELVQMRNDTKLSVSRISADLEKMESRAKHSEKESALLKEQVKELKEQLDKCVQEKLELQKQLFTESSESHFKDNSLLVKHLREELKNYESEVCEARKIKASHEDTELLKEKLREEKSRRERAELDLLKLSDDTDQMSNMKKLEDELSTWKSVIKELPGVSSAEDIPSQFAALQKKVVEGMRHKSETQEKVIEYQVALDKAILDKQNAETETAMVEEKAESYKAEIKRLEMMISSVTEEKDRLKNVVKELKEHKNLGGGTVTIHRELEISLAEKENYVRQLENSLSELKEINNRQHNEISLLNVRLTNEARQVKMLERDGDRLRSEISILESKVGHGDFSSASTKVLRMVNTLAVETEAKQTIEALQNELQKTKEKLLAVEELKKQSPDAGTHVDSYVAGKIKQLKEQIATLEKREERYKTVFAERISVFRRACCELFGYKIVMDDHQRSDGIPVTRFTLHSIYAMTDDEKLQFDYESGNTNIVVNAYTSQPEISRQVDIFIRKMNSIPAFTANLTVESFNKRTLS